MERRRLSPIDGREVELEISSSGSYRRTWWSWRRDFSPIDLDLVERRETTLSYRSGPGGSWRRDRERERLSPIRRDLVELERRLLPIDGPRRSWRETLSIWDWYLVEAGEVQTCFL
ncbi:hypothetical protein NHX12_024365 [Muraenolepis orangiensis]|uniref:Uncharacterized protein n=1 Tax=Muraenolepis orangiensis TaxID=630683 RepID=A0A9Q0D7P0_9TELE|nr:hypothetical protein NHX12_024365 [Muraenolepis orangiensis]